jgi:hypothetical protein
MQTAEQKLKQQNDDAEREQKLKQQRAEQGVIVPASKSMALTNGGASPISAYLAAHGVGMTGTFFKFGKDGFVTTSDETAIPEGTQFTVIYDQVVGGWIKFMGKGNPPIRKQGQLFEGFVPVPRSELGDNDREEWELGLSGQPQDPWQIQLLLPLQNVETGELFVFQTTSVTGRRAVDNLIQQCAQMQRKDPDHYPVVKLRIGGFEHRDERVGWVKTPAFERVGKAPKADTTVAATTVAEDMNDAIPY